MHEGENSQLVPATRARRRISSTRWEQIKTAYASGIGLREMARNMGIPAGTVLAGAKRHGWSRHSARVNRRPQTLRAIVCNHPMQSRGGFSAQKPVGMLSISG